MPTRQFQNLDAAVQARDTVGSQERDRQMPDGQHSDLLITAIMPTADRRGFLPEAIASFLSQTVDCAELVILDDGADPVGDLVQAHPRVRYERLAAPMALGAKRNRLCHIARGAVIVHWDDDDWHAPDRLERQFTALQGSRADICGVDHTIFLAADGSAAWDYTYLGPGPWVAGGSLCYRRAYWNGHPFPEIRVGEDTKWILAAPRDRVHVMTDNTFFVARVHPGNTSPKQTQSTWWRPRSPASVLALMQDSSPQADLERGMVVVGGSPSAVIERPRAQFGDDMAGQGLSIVIPFGGQERLSQLATVLCALRQSPVARQIIIAEMGSAPLACDLARRWAADHVFIAAQGPFEKARAINTGSLLATQSSILWCDGDLIVEGDFLARALKEFTTRTLDFLFPFSRIDYLDEGHTRAVCDGTRDPGSCPPQRVLRPVDGGAIGGMGLVSRQFLRRYGGMIEGFVGWGGEDNAWVHKVSLLGTLGVTHLEDQVAHHLHHPGSGAIEQPWLRNAHYDSNLSLLRRVQGIRDAANLLATFPPTARRTPPWPGSADICFAVDANGSDRLALANDWAQRLHRAFGTTVQVMNVQQALTVGINERRFDIVVAFTDPDVDSDLAAAFADRPFIIVESRTDPDANGAKGLNSRSLLLGRSRDQIEGWRRLGKPVWHMPWDVPVAEDALPVVLGPLSVMLATENVVTVPIMAQPVAFPVWTYWEGPRHTWIERCLETARLHVPNLRILTPAEFDELWDQDRDIDLSHLHVAQRADFIRAFLLMRFGGLWIDADCIVMRDLSPLITRLRDFDVIAHRERQGLFSNAFLAMKPDSAIARRFYETICARLRSGQPLGWIALGNEPLSALLTGASEPILELKTAAVQPICWSRPDLFFRRADDGEHGRQHDPNAWCYMLSNQNIIHYGRGQAQGALTVDNTFFSYLCRKASQNADNSPINVAAATRSARILSGPVVRSDQTSHQHLFERMNTNHRYEGQESISGPGSSLQQTAELRRRLPLLVQSLGIRVLLDAPCGDFNWMSRVNLGDCDYIGIDLIDDIIRRNQTHHGGPGRDFRMLDILTDRLPEVDMIVCRDCLVHLSFDDITRALRGFVESGSRYLLTTTFPGRENRDIRMGGWRPLNLQAPPFSLRAPIKMIDEKCTESGGAFADKSLGLWRLADVSARLDDGDT